GRVADPGVRLEVADRRSARASRVDQEGAQALARARGLLAGDGETDVTGGRFGVVERGGQRGALEAGGAAVAPGRLLLVVPGELRGGGAGQGHQRRRLLRLRAGRARRTPGGAARDEQRGGEQGGSGTDPARGAP